MVITMRVEHIKIANYRQYKDVDFSFPKKGEYDLHLVIGVNGIGKTNLLNAITWCLYDEEPHLGIESKALPVVNMESFRNTDIGHTCNVKVEIFAQSDSGPVSFIKEATYRKTEEKEPFWISGNFEVCVMFEDGNSKIFANEEGKKWVNRFVPHGIREFFFFDGEQLNTYFISDKRLRIETPIYEISQVNLLNKIDEHLSSIIRELKRESGRTNPDLDKLYRDQESALSRKEQAESELRECKDQIATSDEIIRKNTEFLRGQEDVTELEAKKTALDTELRNIREKKKDKTLEIRNFIREYTTMILLYPNVKKTLQVINEKETHGQLPPNIDKNFLRRMLQKEKCLICKKDLDDDGRDNIDKIIKELEMSSEVSHLLTKIKGPLEIILEKVANYKTNKEKLLSEMEALEKREKELQKEVSIIDTKLSSCSNKEAIKNAINERKMHESLKELNLRKEGTLIERYDKACKDYSKAEDAYNKALEKSRGQERLKKIKAFAETANKIAGEIKNELMSEMREKTREVMQDLFLKLIWKANTFDKVLLDESYSISLLHKDGYECLGSCSAAERALLALSFTLALHQVSGFDAPLVIDTPVSRVSDKNRTNFADVLRGVSRDKQLILLFTPSEYSDEIENVFDGISSSKNVIESHDERTTFVRRY